MPSEWYRWTDESAANSALSYINSHPGIQSIPGTSSWSVSVVLCTDGLYGFARIPDASLDAAGISEGERSQFIDVLVTGAGGVIEPFDQAWLPERDRDGNIVS